MPEPLERHYTPQQLADALQLDVSTVRRRLEQRNDVVRVGDPIGTRRTRRHVTYRVPQSTWERIAKEGL